MESKQNLPWLEVAFKSIGVAEVQGIKSNPEIVAWLKDLNAWWSDDKTAWCGVFVAHCLKEANQHYPKMWMQALAYRDGGTHLDQPAFGCVAVKERKGGGHVCFVVGVDEDSGKLVCLGGNQNDKVCLALYDKSVFAEFRWYGDGFVPSAELPKYKGIKLQEVAEA
jgi:uncharacterized protein (TIGR02594 family)